MDQNRVENQVDEGTLQIHLTNASTGIPVKGAKISISYTGGPQQVLEEVDTDDSGNTEKITLDAPPLEYSMEPGENQPYAEYTIKVHATGYRDITVSAINMMHIPCMENIHRKFRRVRLRRWKKPEKLS